MKPLVLLALATSLLPAITVPTISLGDVDPAGITVVPADQLSGVVCSPALPTPLTESVNTITVKNTSGGPVPDLSVVVLLTASNPACPGAVLTGTTNAAGITTITVAASGCSDFVPSACVIKINGVTIRSYINCKSPDFDGASGNGLVNLADLIAFANEFNGVTLPGCHDYTNDNTTNLSDLIPFGSAFSTAKHCP